MSTLTRRTFFKRVAAGTGAAWTVAGGMAPEVLPAAEDGFQARFCICNETFGDWPMEKAFAVAAQCGYRGIEIAPFTISNYVTDVSAQQRRDLRRQAEKAGLEVVGLHWLLAKTEGLHLTSPDEAVRRKTSEYLVALARFCSDLGGKLLVFGSPKQRNLLPGVSQDDAYRHAAEVFRRVIPTLEKTGVVLALEPLSPRITDFLSTTAEAVRLIEMLDSPHCRLILDCNAMSTESKPIPELIRENRRLLTHFHANDPNQQGPGFGKLDFVPVLGALREIKYRGWISVEVFDYTPGPEHLARRSIEYMRECLAKRR